MTEEERMRLGGGQAVQGQTQTAAQQPVAQAQVTQQPQQAAQMAQAPAVPSASPADAQISNAYQAITGQAPFRYNLDQDALYQMYRDRYTQNAKRAMQDTMGQAASLTGGYGNTYSQWVGQQAYDETMRGLTDLIPQLEDRAWNRQQQTYSQISNSILTTGYMPTAAELQAAGMTQEQADALRQAWIASNPGAAWMQGAMTQDQYYALTGKLPPGAAGAGGGGGGGWGSGSSGKSSSTGEKTGDNVLKDASDTEAVRAYLAMYQGDPAAYQTALSNVGLNQSNAALPYTNSPKQRRV